MSELSDDEYDVDEILDIREHSTEATVEYLVKWCEGDPTWEPAKNVLPTCQGMVDEFMAKVRLDLFLIVKLPYFPALFHKMF